MSAVAARVPAAAPRNAADLRKLRRTIIETASAAGEGHIPSALSILDIVWVLYDSVLTIDWADPECELRDRFVLSKGHGCLALYAVLAEKGFFPPGSLASFGKYNSPFGGHPDCNKLPGVEASTGSLGHGFPIAVGCALGLRVRRLPARVVCLIGDGEANEGSVWEAAMVAAHHRLHNLTCVVDDNHSTDRALGLGDIGAKFAAFGWSVREVDGHDHAALQQAFARDGGGGKPVSIIAHTVKGYGCAALENEPAWHHRAPAGTELTELLRSLA